MNDRGARTHALTNGEEENIRRVNISSYLFVLIIKCLLACCYICFSSCCFFSKEKIPKQTTVQFAVT